MKIDETIPKVRLRLLDMVSAGRRKFTFPVNHSPSDNVFHCCLHKSGSQWIRRILSDAVVYRHSGLRTYHYQSLFPEGHDPRPVNARRFPSPFPVRTIVTPLYISYDGYAAVPKPPSSRAFFVTRDPRDVVVSWYFSSMISHRLMGDLGQVRSTLADLDQVEGLKYAIRYLDTFGLFAAQRSWHESVIDPSVIIVRFEDLVGSPGRWWFRELFSHLRISIPHNDLDRVIVANSFEKLSGRARGDEDVRSHLRKGISGDWRNYFTADVMSAFSAVTGDLVDVLGYAEE